MSDETKEHNDQIITELQATKKRQPIQPHELFGPLYKEITLLSQGQSIENLNNTKQTLETLINAIKQQRASKTNKITGTMVTCTLGNGSKANTKSKHKKQKFF